MLLVLSTIAALNGMADTAGNAVIRAMHARYNATYPRTLAVVQKTTFGNGTIETWYKTTSLPGRMRIDFAPASMGRTVLFRGDSVYRWDRGTLQGAALAPYRMLTLLRDVFVQAPEATIAALRGAGFDLDVTHETTWEGRPVTVVGAALGDSTSRQFWVDRERLVVVRFREPLPNGMPLDARMSGYREVQGALIEHEVTIRVNGQVAQTDLHHEVTIGLELEAGLFDTSTPRLPTWAVQLTPRWP